MRHLRLALLGFLLVLPIGCGGKTEEGKSPDPGKTENAAANNPKGNNTTPDNNTTPEVNNNTPANNTPIRPAVNVPPSDGSEYAMVPKGTIALLSIRPAAALNSKFVRSMPDQDQLENQLAQMKQNLGFDATNIASVTVALWPGDGHVIPDLSQIAQPPGGGAPPPSFNQPPEKPGDDNGDAATSDAAADPTDCSYQPPGGPDGPAGGGNPIAAMIMNMVPKLDGAVFVQLNVATDLKSLQERIPQLAALQEETLEGKPALAFNELPVGGGAAVYQADPKTLVITFKDDVKEILSNDGESELVKKAKAQGSEVDAALLLDFSPFSPLITLAAGLASAQSPEAGKVLPNLKGTSLFIDWNDGVDINVMIDAKDEATIATLKKEIDANSQNLEGMLPNMTMNLPPGTSDQAKAEIQQLGQNVYDSFTAKASGTRLHLSLRVPETAVDTIKKVEEEQNR